MTLVKQHTLSYLSPAFSKAQENGYLQIPLLGSEELLTEWTIWCAKLNLPIITLVESLDEAELLVDLSFTNRVLTDDDQAGLHAAWLRRQPYSISHYELTPMLCHFGSLSVSQAKVLAESIQALLLMQG